MNVMEPTKNTAPAAKTPATTPFKEHDDPDMNVAFAKFNSFQQTRNEGDLSSAIEHLRRVLEKERAPAGVNPSHLSLLAVFLEQRYSLTANEGDLDQAIEASCAAVKALTNEDVEERHAFFHNLRAILLRRYQKTGDAGELKKAVATMEQVREEYEKDCRQGGEAGDIRDMPRILDILLDFCVETCDVLGEPSYLDMAIEVGCAIEALDSGPARVLLNATNTLGNLYHRRYAERREARDLDLAVAVCDKTVRIVLATDIGEKLQILSFRNLAVALRQRFVSSEGQNPEDLRRAIQALCKAASSLTSAPARTGDGAGNIPGRHLILEGLRDLIRVWYEHMNVLPPVEEVLLDACPDDLRGLMPERCPGVEKAEWLFQAASQFEDRSDRGGHDHGPDDLECAVLATQWALDVTNPENPRFGNMETALRGRLRKWSDMTGKIPESEVQLIAFSHGATYIPPELAEGQLGLYVGKAYNHARNLR